MNILKLSTITILFIIGMTSCNKDINLENISNEEVAEIISNALQSSSNGMAEEFSDMAQQVVNIIQDDYECNVAFDTSFVKSLSKLNVSASYNVDWTWTPTCNNFNKMTLLDYQSVAVGGYESPKSSSQGTKTTLVEITGTQLSTNLLTYSGTTHYVGSQTVSVKSAKTLNAESTITMDNITLNKLNKEIEDGTASFVIVVGQSNGVSETFNGTIDFLGGMSATITINGEVFQISL